MAEHRTEQPTQRRVEKARREGNFAVAREFVGAVQFAALVGLLAAFAPGWLAQARQGLRGLLAQAFRAQDLGRGEVAALAREVIPPLAAAGGLAGALVLAVTLGVQLATTGMGLAPSKLKPDLKRLDPLRKLKGLPRQNLPMFVQAAVLLPLFAWALHAVAAANLGTFLRLPLMSAEAGLAQVGASIRDLLWKAAGLLLLVGAIDLYRQRRRYRKDLRMSKQEVRDELKETEGNPQVKMRVRRLQRDLLRRRMMQEVPRATAVVVNPTHYAVALRYDPAAAAAPVVVAKGRNYLAARIRQIAAEHEIPIVENPPLAQALYKSVEVGQEIPVHLYRAVAEILAYIFRLMGGRMPGRN